MVGFIEAKWRYDSNSLVWMLAERLCVKDKWKTVYGKYEIFSSRLQWIVLKVGAIHDEIEVRCVSPGNRMRDVEGS